MSEHIIKCNIDDDVYNEFLSILGKNMVSPATFIECAAKELTENKESSANVLYDWLKYSSTIQNLQPADSLLYYILNVLEHEQNFMMSIESFEERVKDRADRIRWIKNSQNKINDPDCTEWEDTYIGIENPVKAYSTRDAWIEDTKKEIKSWEEDIAEFTSEIDDVWKPYIEWTHDANPDFDKEMHIIRRYLSENFDYKIDIRDYRKLYGMTQQELADKIGVTKCTIANYENGRVSLAKIPNSTLQKLADVFEVPVERIV